jgi:hypothetical protein
MSRLSRAVKSRRLGLASGVLPLAGMKDTRHMTLDDLSVPELRRRGARARERIRAVRCAIGSVGGLRSIDAALDEVEALLPGLMNRPWSLIDRAVRDLGEHERSALREAIDAERAARERLGRMLGEISPADADEALARVEERESVWAELFGLLQLFERAHGAAALAPCA